MTHSAIFIFAVASAASLAASAVILSIIMCFIWLLDSLQDDDSLSHIWRFTGIRFFCIMSIIMAAVILPLSYRIVAFCFARNGDTSDTVEKPCSCSCAACRNCEGRSGK